MVETAMVLPVILLVLMGTISFSEVFYWRSQIIGVVWASITSYGQATTSAYNRLTPDAYGEPYDFDAGNAFATQQATYDYPTTQGALQSYPRSQAFCQSTQAQISSTDSYSTPSHICTNNDDDHMVLRDSEQAGFTLTPTFTNILSSPSISAQAEIDGPIRSRIVE